jgi:O-antigen ligase
MPLALERETWSGLGAWWRRNAMPEYDETGMEASEPGKRRNPHRYFLLAGIAALGLLWGAIVAVAELNALYLSVSLIGCAFILRDFRVGVVLLVVLMPISRSWVFPHAMMGVTGLNPFNLLLVATLGSYMLRGLSAPAAGHLVPRRLLWLYIVPILVAGAMGSFHVDEIPSFLRDNEVIDFDNVIGYIRDMLFKPLMMVIFAMLVGVAAAHSEKPEKFIVPAVVAIWVMSVMVIVFVAMSGISLKEMASSESREFLSALGMHANALGRLYVSGYAILLFVWIEAKDRTFKFVLLVSMVLATVALVLTFSRGAFLSFILVNFLFLFWRRNAKTWIFFGVLAICVLVIMPAAVYERMATGFGNGFDSGSGAITAGRVEFLWVPLLPEILRSPIYGHGLNSILWSEPMRAGGGVTFLAVEHPHNGYLQALLDMGIVGLVLMCAFFLHVWKNFRALSVNSDFTPTLRGFYLGSAAGLASLLLSYATDSSLTPGPEQSFLWLAIGMMYGQMPKAGTAKRSDAGVGGRSPNAFRAGGPQIHTPAASSAATGSRHPVSGTGSIAQLRSWRPKP